MAQAAREMGMPEGFDAPRVDPANARTYDFRTGSELSREALSQLRLHCDRLATALGRIVTAYLDSASRFEVTAAGGQTLEDFLADLDMGSVLGLVQVAPALPQVVLQIGRELVGPIVGRMLGGPPETVDRPATPLEAALLKRFTQEMLDIWATTWERLARRQPVVAEMLTDAAQLQGKVREGETVRVAMAAEIAGVSGEMNICLPVSVVQHLVAEGDDGPSRSQVDDRRLRTAGERIVVPVSVRVHEMKMPMSEVMKLGPGDVIPLGKPVGEPMTVAVRGRRKFLAETGVMDGRLAARVIGPIGERKT